MPFAAIDEPDFGPHFGNKKIFVRIVLLDITIKRIDFNTRNRKGSVLPAVEALRVRLSRFCSVCSNTFSKFGPSAFRLLNLVHRLCRGTVAPNNANGHRKKTGSKTAPFHDVSRSVRLFDRTNSGDKQPRGRSLLSSTTNNRQDTSLNSRRQLRPSRNDLVQIAVACGKLHGFCTASSAHTRFFLICGVFGSFREPIAVNRNSQVIAGQGVASSFLLLFLTRFSSTDDFCGNFSRLLLSFQSLEVLARKSLRALVPALCMAHFAKNNSFHRLTVFHNYG